MKRNEAEAAVTVILGLAASAEDRTIAFGLIAASLPERENYIQFYVINNQIHYPDS